MPDDFSAAATLGDPDKVIRLKIAQSVKATHDLLSGGTGAGTSTPVITTVSASGTVAAGFRKVTFIFSADFAGTVLGATFDGATDASLSLEAPVGSVLAAVAYTRSAGSIRIITLT